MKKLLFLFFTLFVSLSSSGQISVYSDTVCSAGAGASNVNNILNPPMSSTSVSLDVWAMGDLNSSTEYVEVYSENGYLLGSVSNPTQCGTYSSTNFTVPLDSFNNWASDGAITFNNTFSSATGFCSPNECIFFIANYTPITGPNDAGVTGVGNLQSECAASLPVMVDIKNFGINQIDSVVINWEIDGIIQPSFMYNNTLDTIGGTGMNSATVTVGNFTFSVGQDYNFRAWTTLPNNTNDTVNLNDTLTTVLRVLSAPIGLSVTNPTVTTADVSWNTGTGGNSYNIIYGVSGFNPATSGTVVSSTTSPYTLTGLSGSTDYDVYISRDCGSGSFSDTAGLVAFRTLCSIITAPWNENFDGTAWTASGSNANNVIDPCWTANPDMSMGTEPFKWIPRSTGPSSGNGPTFDATGGNFMYVEASGSSAGDIAYLTTPPIDVSNLTTPALYFMEHRYSNGNIADLDVEVTSDGGTTWTTHYSITGDVQTSSSAPWTLSFVNLANYTGDTISIRFKQTGKGCCGDAAIDSVVVNEAPSCPWPTGFSFVGSSSTTATFAWSDPSNTSWDIEYGAPGFTSGSGTVVTVNSNPGTITGLTPSTSYEAYIRANCTASGNGTSIWGGPVSFYTKCQSIAAPFSENFDGSTWVASGSNTNNQLDICWSSSPDVSQGSEPFKWIPRSTGPTSGNGPLNDATGGNYMYVEASGSTAGDVAYLTSPLIDLSALTVPALYFHQHRYGGGTIADMKIDVSNNGGTTWNTLYNISGDLQTSSADPWSMDMINLAAYTNDTILIRFVQVGNGCCGDAAIDSVVVAEAPACPWPANFSFTGSGSTTATFSWTDPSGTSWDIEYGAPGFISGSGTVVTVNSNPGTITGLTPSTSYEAYIRANCTASGNGTSNWVGPVAFDTKCVTLVAPYSENFDGSTWVASGSNTGNQIDLCWSSNPDVSQGSEPFKWIPRSTGPTSGNGPLNDATGGNYMYVEASSSTAGDVAYLTSPLIDLSALTTPALYFHQHRYSGGTIADMKIDVSNNGGASWSSLYTIIGDIQTSSSDPWSLDMVNLAAFTNDTVIIRFVQEGNGCCGDAAIDSIVVDEAPACPWPTSLALSSTTSSSATVGWYDPSGSSWDIEYGLTGFTTGSGTTVNTSTNPYTITGLAANTSYDVYINTNCTAAGNGKSIVIGPLNFTTQCASFTAPYFNDFELDPLDVPPVCWFDFETYSASFVEVENFTGTAGPYAGSQALYLYNSGASISDTLMAITPHFSDLTAADKQVRFYANSDDPITQLIVGTVANPLQPQTFSPIDTITFAVPDTYQEVIVQIDSVNGYNGVHEYVALMHNNVTTFDYIRIDDFNYEIIPACPKINQLVVTGTTTNSVSITFNTNGGTLFDYEWGPTGFTQGTGGQGTITGSPATIIGMNPAQTYDLYIRVDCGVSGVSIWEGPVTFTTKCQALVAPYTENFDGAQWVASGSNLNNTIGNCWSSNPDVGQGSEPFKWIPRATGPTSGNGPLNDVTGGNFMYVEASGSSSGDVAILTSPPVDLSNLTTPSLYFYEHRYYTSATIADMKVDVSNDGGNTWTTEYTITGTTQSSSSDPWTQIYVDLTAYAGDTIITRFVQTGKGCCGDAAIDDVRFQSKILCAPTSMADINLGLATQDSVYIYWTPGEGNSWQVEIGNPGFTPGIQAGLDSVHSIDTTAGFAGLSPQTTYEIYIRDSCTAGVSTWVGPFSFTTACTVANMTYYESFDNWPLSCWDNSQGSEQWASYTGAGTDLYAMADFWSTSIGDYVLSSRPIAITQDAQVKFDWSHLYSASYPDEQLMVLVHSFSNSTYDTILILKGPGNFNDPTASNTAPGQFITETVVLDPNVYTGDTIIVTLWAISDFGPNLYVNNFYVENAPTCINPSNQNVSNITTNGADFSWSNISNAIAYQVWYGPQGFFQGTQTSTGTKVISSTNSLSLTTLSSSTCYDYYVRAICSPGDTSIFTGPLTFCTSCSVKSTPYIEDFDGTSWVASGSNTGNQIDVCWSSDPDVSMGAEPFKWIPRSTGPTSGNGPLADVTGGNFMYVEASGSSTGDSAVLTSPAIDVGGLTAPMLYFHQHRYNANASIADMDVEISNDNGMTWTQVYSINTVTQTASSSPWDEISVNLSSYLNDTIVIRFIQIGKGCCGDAAIDNFRVIDAPTCFKPTAVSVTNITSVSADVSWTTGGATNWQIEYGPVGFALGSGTFITNATNPHTITGLNPATTYEVYVRDSCGPGDVSFWSVSQTFGTACAPLNAPYLQDFALGGIPFCYSTSGASGTTGNSIWKSTSSSSWPAYGAAGMTNAPGSAGYAMGVDGSSPANDTAVVMITDDINLSTVGNPTLSFMKFQNNTNGGTNMTLYVDIHNNGSWDRNVIVDNLNNTSWVQHSAPLSAYSGVIKIRFRVDKTTGTTSFYSDIIVDDIEVNGTCAAPDSLNVTNLSCTSADLMWISNNPGMSIIAYGPSGFTPGTGAGTITFAQSPYPLTGLTKGSAYEFYVADTCGGDTSTIMGPFAFTTPTGPLSAAFNSVINPATLNDLTVDFDASTSAGASSYTWDFGDNSPIGSGINVSHSYLSNGVYNVELFISGDCGTDSITKTVIIDGISINEHAFENSIKLYPNPSSDFISLEFEAPAPNVSLRITDVSGKLFMEMDYNKVNDLFKEYIDISRLAKGVYLLEIKSGDEITFKKIRKD